MTSAELLALALEIFQISVKVYKAVSSVTPELSELWSDFVILASSEPTEDQVKALRAKIVALSDENATLEQQLIGQ